MLQWCNIHHCNLFKRSKDKTWPTSNLKRGNPLPWEWLLVTIKTIAKWPRRQQQYAHWKINWHYPLTRTQTMMTSSNGIIFCASGPLCGEFSGHWWIPLTNASDAELWCFIWSTPKINGSVNNREAGDLRRDRTHYDVTVMQNAIDFRATL